MQTPTSSLPIDEVLPNLLETLNRQPSVVLQAPPGAGKTTRVPLALLDQPWVAGRKIIMLEPRRLAARSAARFMARQLNEPVGQRVGYRTRLDSQISFNTRIEVVTEGILTRMLQDDPSLESYAAVIFDEFHERSLAADLGLALSLETQQALREDLRILVMSATLDAAPLARLLGEAPLITSEGRSFPVDTFYLPAPRGQLDAHLVSVVQQALREQPGSILVFLPGSGEIRRLAQVLQDSLPEQVFVAPLYGDLGQEAQDAAIQPAPAGKRKIVLATSIAETSLTIEGVRVVIDAGLQRSPSFDPVTGMSRLQTRRISQAAAEQRRGRAGRTEPGACYRLWSASEQTQLEPHAAPEIATTDLSELVLELALWGVQDPGQLTWLTPPPEATWHQARALLQRLQALDQAGRITMHGKALGRLGMHPRLAHMIERAQALGWGGLGVELAALLGDRDLLTGTRHSDIYDRLAALRGDAARGMVEHRRVQQVRRSAQQLKQRLKLRNSARETGEAAGILLAFAYPDRIAKRRPGKAPRYLLANGRGAFLFDEDPLQHAPFIVAAELDNEGREARIFLAGEISLAAIEEHFAELIEEREAVIWDESAEVIRAQRQTRLGALVLEERPLERPDPTAILDALLQVVRQRELADLPWNKECRQWQARVRFLRQHEGDSWPEVTDQQLKVSLEQWLAPFAAGFTRMSQFRNFPLRQALNSLLTYEQQRQLEHQAPTHLEVPSGSCIPLDYESGDQPVLAVRLQELFGLTQTPCLVHGRVPVMLHLLSPSQRPVQVTQDLASFWRNGYPEVRKDLRGRYPKHPWPEDPFSAPPTRHTKKRQERAQ